jgi:cellobiose phosphorylase
MPISSWTSAAGLRVEVEADGTLRSLSLGDVVVNLFVGNALEGGPANLVLRRHDATATSTTSTLLLGPSSPTRWRADPAAGKLDGAGSWRGIDYRVSLRLAADAPAWFWHVHVVNTGAEPARIDLMAWQDVALAPYGAIRLNEYYVSQYVDHTPLSHADRGIVLASRQNQAVGPRYPWCLTGSLVHCVAYATDALQVYGLATRAGAPAPSRSEGLPSSRLQHEHSMAALQDRICELAPGEAANLGWFGRVVADHPDATSASDLSVVDHTLALPEAAPPAWNADDLPTTPSAASLFLTAPLLPALDLDEPALDGVFGSERRHVERDAHGHVISFFHGVNAHVALRAKELAVLRPHGQVLRTGTLSVPDESALTSTVWMGGVFHSMLTQGHVSINRCLSTVRTYLGLFRSQGLRVFIETDIGWQLLDQPSAFEMQPEACRWIYRFQGGRVDVTSSAHSDPHAFGLHLEFVEGPVARCLVCLHVALNGDDGATTGRAIWKLDGNHVVLSPAAATEMARRFPDGHLRIEPSPGTTIERVGGDETLFPDGIARDLPYLTLTTSPSRSVRFQLTGTFVTGGPNVPPSTAPGPGSARLTLGSQIAPAPAESPAAARLAGLMDLMPWLEQNALVHYLAPRGLEQFSGGGWGTRDVCQGPMEYLLAQGQNEAMRDLLLRVMKAQNTDGDWPQWFMFFDRDDGIRAGDSHGDIVFWPLLALGQYLIASGDEAILDERVSFYSSPPVTRLPGTGPTVWQHALQALALIRRRVLPGTALAAYGHGDWNDALQPVDPAMRLNMCSAWTVTLHHQTLSTLARGLRAIGRKADAANLEREAVAVQRDFGRLLVVDGVLAGYARFDEPGDDARITYLLHPRDDTTGVRYSLLAMIHAIIEGLFDTAQMREHLRVIDEHLMGPDGARLFDRPLAYRGGLQTHFQRAESACFFGREIGLMYTHAHLRYAQALAHVGESERFFHALCQANPIGLSALVPTAAPRPSNSYYSSSDAAFADRYQASAEYERVRDGTIRLEGGWRVYSSGAGILSSLVVQHLFGLRLEADALLIDPVMPASLNGMRVRFVLLQREIEITYEIKGPGFGVTALLLNDRPLSFEEEPQPYRRGAARVKLQELELDGEGPKRLVIRVGA